MVEVNISKDGMLAEVCVRPESGETITPESIEEQLRLEGVQIGIDKKAIAAILADEICGEFVPVARGREPVDGTDGKYEYFFACDDGKPRMREDGSVDYSMVIANVVAGDLVAEYHEPTGGTFGYNVFARALSPVKGKHDRTLLLKNVRREENKFYAEIDGHVSLNEATLSVQNIYTVTGDADYTRGDIRFNGDIHITGNICGGVTIRAEGSVNVDGVIEDARVYAGQDIVVNQGVHGQGAGRDEAVLDDTSTFLEAGGFVKARFIDHAVVRAAGDVFVDYALGAAILCEGTVTASGSRGAIIGGRVIAHRGIDAEIVGNTAELATELRIGTSQRLRDELAQAQQALKDLAENQKSPTPQIPSEELTAAVNEAKSRILEAEILVRQNQSAPIIIRNKIHHNVRLFFGETALPDQAGRTRAEFRKLSGRVLCKTIGSYSKSELEAYMVDLSAQTLGIDKRKVLLIDDDARLLRTVHGMLEETYQVAATTNGRAARKYLEKNAPELILLDYMMPDENGVEVLKSLRAWDKTKDIPVVFLTGLDDKKKILECLALHPAGYITKPVSRDSLLAKIHAVLGDE